MAHVLVLSGPNLNLLGRREPEVYGSTTLEQIHQRLFQRATAAGIGLDCFQSNHEGAIIDKIHDTMGVSNGLIINPGAYTHTSVAIRDAIAGVQIPTIEVHLSNVHAREDFRHHSYVTPVAWGMICGLGAQGYELALDAFIQRMREEGLLK